MAETSNVTDPQKTHYEVLGVAKTAGDAEIKAAFRTLARQWHPDICKLPNAEEKFKQIQAAYETLLDEDKRRDYDAVLRLNEASKLPPDPVDIVDSMFGVKAVSEQRTRRKKNRTVKRPSYDDIPEGIVDRIDDESTLGGVL